jgi:hypothetical protein
MIKLVTEEAEIEIKNLKSLTKKAIKPEDLPLVETLTEYLEAFCKIKHDCFGAILVDGLHKLGEKIDANALDRGNQIRGLSEQIDKIMRELHLNGYGKKV